jgi:predicted Zn-dependent peptidase
MVRHSRFDPEEIEKERQVINEEISMSRDSPACLVDLLIDEVLWPGHALGRDVAGTKETVSRITREMLLGFVTRQYLPNTTVIGVAGRVEHESVVSAIARQFQDWERAASPRWLPAVDNQTSPRVKVEYKDTEQAHLCLALPGLSLLHPDRYALDLLSAILGEGMSSRLFQEIREKRGLAYDIHSYISYFQDTGALIVGAGVDPRRLPRAISAILTELSRLKEGIPQDELKRAKEMTKGRMLLRLEDSRAMAGSLAAQELLLNRVRTIDEMLSIIDAITAEDLERIANQLLHYEKLNLAVVGPLKNGDSLKDLLHL